MMTPQNLLLTLLASLPLILTHGCGSESRINVSDAGMRLCRERQADLPLGSTAEQRRLGYQTCLKSIDAELSEQQNEAKQEEQERQQNRSSAEQAERSSWATPSDRLTHCLLVQEQVKRAAQARREALGPVMELSKQYGVNSPQAQEANAAYQDTLAELERLIPEEMRHGAPLVPTSVNLFTTCDRRELGIEP